MGPRPSKLKKIWFKWILDLSKRKNQKSGTRGTFPSANGIILFNGLHVVTYTVLSYKKIFSKKVSKSQLCHKFWYEIGSFRLKNSISGEFLGQKLGLNHEKFDIKCRTSSILEAFLMKIHEMNEKKSFDKPNSDIKRATWFLLLTIPNFFRRRSKSVSTELVSISLIKKNFTTEPTPITDTSPLKLTLTKIRIVFGNIFIFYP